MCPLDRGGWARLRSRWRNAGMPYSLGVSSRRSVRRLRVWSSETPELARLAVTLREPPAPATFVRGRERMGAEPTGGSSTDARREGELRSVVRPEVYSFRREHSTARAGSPRSQPRSGGQRARAYAATTLSSAGSSLAEKSERDNSLSGFLLLTAVWSDVPCRWSRRGIDALVSR